MPELGSEEILAAASGDHLITAYGAHPECGDNRAEIQAAIEACAAAGGGRVVIPPGRWVSGSLRLRSRVELHLAPGAMILASRDESGYPELAKTENLPRVIRALVWADGAESIAITGRGMLHGDGDSELWFKEAATTFFRPALIFLRNCRGVLLRDTRLHYSQFWTCHLMRCEDVVIDAIDIRTHRKRINADGIDPDGCRNVRISNCHIESTDDALCFKSTEGDVCEDIVVTNCILSSRCAAIKLGTESIGPIRNLQITNCIVRDTEMGIAFFQKDCGGFHDITISNVSMECAGPFPILLDNSRRWRGQKGVGAIRSLLLENIRCRGPGRMLLRGHPEAPVRDLVLRGISFLLTGGVDFAQAGLPAGSARSEVEPGRPLDIQRAYQAVITDVTRLRLDDFTVAEERTEGRGDRGIAYLRACNGVRGSWTHRLEGLDGLPGDEAVVVEESAGVELVGQ